jgi:toxin ParE1/3/4
LKPITILPPAEVELQGATNWYRERDPRVGARFTAEVRRTLELIESFSQIGGRVSGVDDPAVRALPVARFPYQIVFVERAETIDVVAFAHHRRRPAYFVERMRRS